MVPYFAVDRPGRIDELLEKGYCFVTREGECSLATPDLSREEGLGSVIRLSVGTHEDGTPQYAYLMAQDKEIYEEDHHNERRQMAETARQLKEGFDEATDSDRRYGKTREETVGLRER